MVLGQQHPLHLEQVLRVAQMRGQLRGDVTARLDRPGEGLHPRRQHRVLLVLGVQRHGAVVGVDGGLHRVADIGHLLIGQQPIVQTHQGGVRRRRAQTRQFRVRDVVQGGVAVDDPHHPLVDDRRVHRGVRRQPRGHRLDPAGRIAVEQDLGVGADHVGEQEVPLGELRGEQRPGHPVAHRHPAAAGVGVVLGLGVGLVVVLAVVAVLADDRVIGGAAGDHRAEVHPRLIQRCRPGRDHTAVGADHAG